MSVAVAAMGRERQDVATHELRTLLQGLPIAALLITGILIGSGSLTLIAAICSIGASLVYPELGLMTLAIVAPLLSRPILPAPGYPVALAGAVLLGCLYRLPVERPRLSISPALLCGLGFMLFVFVRQAPDLLAGYTSVDAHWTGSLMTKLLTGLLVIIDTALILRGRSVYPFVTALLLSAVATALVAITTSSANPTGVLANLVAPSSDAASRPSGSFGDPNEYGLFLAAGIVLCLGWLLFGRPGKAVRFLLVAALVTLALGIANSLSRTAIASLLAGVVVLGFGRSRRTGLAIATVAVVAGVVVYPFLIDARLTASFGSATPFGAAALAHSDAGRLARVLAGPLLFASSPVFGVGLGGYQTITGDASHNYYMTLLGEEGTVGVILWALMLVALATALRRRPRTAKANGFAMLGVFLVGCLFLDPPHEDQLSVLIATAIVAALTGNWREELPSQNAPGADPRMFGTTAIQP